MNKLNHLFIAATISTWKTGSTASTETPVPDWGMANTSITRTGRDKIVKNKATVYWGIQLTDFDLTCVFVNELSKHETHDLHGDSSAAVLQHL